MASMYGSAAFCHIGRTHTTLKVRATPSPKISVVPAPEVTPTLLHASHSSSPHVITLRAPISTKWEWWVRSPGTSAVSAGAAPRLPPHTSFHCRPRHTCHRRFPREPRIKSFTTEAALYATHSPWHAQPSGQDGDVYLCKGGEPAPKTFSPPVSLDSSHALLGPQTVLVRTFQKAWDYTCKR